VTGGRREEEAEGDEDRDTESKTRTPHKVVGENHVRGGRKGLPPENGPRSSPHLFELHIAYTRAVLILPLLLIILAILVITTVIIIHLRSFKV